MTEEGGHSMIEGEKRIKEERKDGTGKENIREREGTMKGKTEQNGEGEK